MTNYASEEVFRARFVAEVQRALKRDKVAPKQLAKDLGLSPRILYRRLSGETPFTAYELATLCRRFNISTADLWAAHVPRLSFDAPLPLDTPFVKTEYLERLRQSVFNGTDVTVTQGYVTSDYLPYLYMYEYQPLALLALYLFELPTQVSTIAPLHLPTFREGNEDWLAATDFQANDWQGVDSEEVWGANPIAFLVGRIETLSRSGLIATEDDAETLFGCIDKLIDGLADCLPAGRKVQGRASLYVGRDWAASTNNVVLLQGTGLNTLLLVYGNGFISSAHPEAVQYFKQYFEGRKMLAEQVTSRISGTRSMIDEMRHRVQVGRRRVLSNITNT